MQTRDAIIKEIAKEVLDLPTLEVRGRDQLDFSDQYVGTLRKALEVAYEAGRRAGQME